MAAKASGFTCPDCGGILWEVREGKLTRFECRVGHKYSPESLVDSHGTRVEGTLWAGLRSLEERAAMFRRMASRARERDRILIAQRYEQAALELDQHATVMRQLVEDINLHPEELEPEETAG